MLRMKQEPKSVTRATTLLLPPMTMMLVPLSTWNTLKRISSPLQAMKSKGLWLVFRPNHKTHMSQDPSRLLPLLQWQLLPPVLFMISLRLTCLQLQTTHTHLWLLHTHLHQMWCPRFHTQDPLIQPLLLLLIPIIYLHSSNLTVHTKRRHRLMWPTTRLLATISKLHLLQMFPLPHLHTQLLPHYNNKHIHQAHCINKPCTKPPRQALWANNTLQRLQQCINNHQQTTFPKITTLILPIFRALWCVFLCPFFELKCLKCLLITIVTLKKNKNYRINRLHGKEASINCTKEESNGASSHWHSNNGCHGFSWCLGSREGANASWVAIVGTVTIAIRWLNGGEVQNYRTLDTH